MKKIIFILFACLASSQMSAQNLDRSIRPTPGPAPIVSLEDPATFTLPNGLKVFVVENHKMPIVTYSLQLAIDPEVPNDKVGLSSFTGELMTRGTKTMNKESFDEAVDKIGGQIGASGRSMSGVSLSKYQDELLTLMSDALLNPAFDEEELKKVVKQAESGLISNENDPDAMLSNVQGVVNFGNHHPYGQVMTYQSIKNVTTADVKNYYETYFRPNVAYLAVVGDITKEQAQKLVSKYFGAWEKQTVPEAKYPSVAIPKETTLNFVNRPGAVQSVIAITYPIDLPIGSPDANAVAAMNQILGGGSTGRLFQNLRERHGWTYGSYSSVSSDRIIGETQLYAKARNVVTDSSITEMLAEMDTIRNLTVTDEILQGTKNYLSGIFALGLESPSNIAQYAINVDRYKLPKDYYKNYLKRVAAVSVADVQKMAQKYIRPHQANIIVVGNTSELEKLKKFSPNGAVNYYDGFGNKMEGDFDKEVNGKKIADVLNMYIDAQGGRKAIEEVKDFTQNANLKMQGRNVGRLVQMKMSPDKFYQLQTYNNPAASTQMDEMTGSMSSMKQVGATNAYAQTIVVNGDNGYMKIGRDKTNLQGEMLTPYQAEADIQSILHPEKYGISYSLIDMTTLEDMPGLQLYEVSKVSNNGKDKAILYINAETGELVKKIENEDQGGRQVLTTRYYSDYRSVSGGSMKVPYSVKVVTPQRTYTLDVRNTKVNSGLKESKFK